MRTLLMLCYFFMLTVNISCKETSNKKVETGVENTEVDDAPEDIPSKKKVILFFGDSLTAGMGVDSEEAFPALIQNKLDSLELAYEVINAGLSGETTAGGKNRIAWVLKQKVDVFVLELGANDGLRGVPISETRKNLQAIIDVVNEKNPETQIILAGMQIPPNMGLDYTTEFKNIFPELAAKNNLKLIPFLLEGVAGIPALNQNDGIHPTAKGQSIVAKNVWTVLKDAVL